MNEEQFSELTNFGSVGQAYVRSHGDMSWYCRRYMVGLTVYIDIDVIVIICHGYDYLKQK